MVEAYFTLLYIRIVSSTKTNEDHVSTILSIFSTFVTCTFQLSCITPKYLQSENCLKELTMAESLRKPIVPILLRFSSWPPEGASVAVRRILSKYTPIDLSTEKLTCQNLPVLLERINRTVGVRQYKYNKSTTYGSSEMDYKE